MNLVQMSLSGAVMIIAIMVMRTLTINRLPKKVFVLLWDVVLLRLLVPFSIPFVLSVYSLVKRAVPVYDVLSDIPTDTVLHQVVENQLNMNVDVAEGIQSEGTGLSIGIIIWIVGMVLCTAFFLASYLHCRFEFRTSIPVHNDFVVNWLEAHRLRRTIQIRQLDRIAAPLTYGIISPVILMPKKTDWRNKQQLQYILSHEYVHICRFDSMVKLIATLALCIHWFNPMVWGMYIFLNRDIELSCDESVVRQFGESAKSNYARTLITMEEKKRGLTPLYNSFSRNAIEERITAIMKTKKLTIGILIASIIVVICIVVPFITSADNTEQSNATNDEFEQSNIKQNVDASNEEIEPVTPSIESTAENSAEDELSGEVLAYVNRVDGMTLVFDIVEWVTVPGERATELGITEDDAPSGFSVYNETDTVAELPLADHCSCKLLDWTGNYVQIDVTREEMVRILDERQGTNIPYHLIIENNEIVEIFEQYVP